MGHITKARLKSNMDGMRIQMKGTLKRERREKERSGERMNTSKVRRKKRKCWKYSICGKCDVLEAVAIHVGL